MAERCPGGWWGRHKLEPRFEKGPAQEVTPQQIDAINRSVLFSDDVVDAIGRLADGGKKYVHDICVHCGRTFPAVGTGKEP